MRIKTWEDFYRSTPSFTDMIRWAATHDAMVQDLVRCGRVLEVGTGTGMLSSFLSKFCSLSVTLDSNQRVLANSRRFVHLVDASVPAVRGDAFRLPFSDLCFDAVFSQGLLEHFDDEAARAIVTEQMRVAPVAYVSVPSVYYPHLGRRGPGLVGNERLLTARQWKRILRGHDVKARYYADIKILTIAGKTLGWPAQLLLRVQRVNQPSPSGSGRCGS